MKQNLRLRGGVCPDEPSEVSYQPLVNAASRTDKILRRVGKASPVMSDELLVISSLVPCVQRYLASYRFLRSAQACLIPPVEMTGNLKDIGRNAREIWRDALTERPNASAGRRNAKKIRRNAKKFRRNARFRDERPIKGLALLALKPYTLYLITLKILFCVCLAQAGQRGLGNSAAAALATDSIKPLQIGDTIPEALWNLPLRMVQAGQEGSTNVTLNDYKGKLIILDFWATWCKPCIRSLGSLNNIQQQLANRIKIVPVSKQGEQTIMNIVASHSNLAFAYSDTVLSNYFPHQTVPHQIWIKDNKVYAITSEQYATLGNIKSLLAGEHIKVREHNDLALEEMITMLSEPAGLGPKPLISANIYPRLKSDVTGQKRNRHNLYLLNMPIKDLYAFAFGFAGAMHRNKILIELNQPYTMNMMNQPQVDRSNYLQDSLFQRWKDLATFCVRLSGTDNLSDDTLMSFLQTYLNGYFGNVFGIHAKRERRILPCLVLQKTAVDSLSNIKTGKRKESLSLNQQPIASLLTTLAIKQADNSLPLLSDIDRDSIYTLKLHADLDNIGELNKELKAQGLILKVEERETDVLVIHDRKEGNND